MDTRNSSSPFPSCKYWRYSWSWYQENIKIPPLKDFIALNEALVNVCGTYPHAKVVGIALNTAALSEVEALEMIKKIEAETACSTTDVIRFGCEKLGRAIQTITP